MDDEGQATPDPLAGGQDRGAATGTGAPPDPERAEALAEIGAGPPAPITPRNDWRRIVLRSVCSLVFLGVLFWRLPEFSPDDLFPTPTAATFGWIAVAVAVHLVAYALQNLRWGQVSDTLGIHLPYRRLFSHLLAGEFVSNALPTSFGGDVVRVMRQGKDVGDYADSFASTSLERLTGWLVLPILSAVGLLAHPEYLQLGAASAVAVVINVVTVLALLAILWGAGHEQGAGRLVAVHLGIVAFRHQPGRVAKVLLAGIGFQFLQCVSVWAAARALDIPQVGLLAAMAFFPPTAVIQNMPFALGGLGVREAAFVLFFGALGVPDARAIGLGLLVYLVFVAASLAGAPSFAVGGRRPSGGGPSPEPGRTAAPDGQG